MSYDVYLEVVQPCSVWDANMTSNVAGIWRAAFKRTIITREPPTEEQNRQHGGAFAWLHGMPPAEATEALRVAAVDIDLHPEIYEPLCPDNGWGNRKGAANFLREIAAAWAENPTAALRVSR